MKLSLFWFRRDLRLEDNTALHYALLSGNPVVPIFIFDRNILDELHVNDPRVNFIYERLKAIDRQLRSPRGSLRIFHGDPLSVWKELIAEMDIGAVYVNRDYEPYAVHRDDTIGILLRSQGIPLRDFKDQVIYERDDIVKSDGKPYTVFTPYKRKWLEAFHNDGIASLSFPGKGKFHATDISFPSIGELGFALSPIRVNPFDLSRLDQYNSLRDYPAADATSYLSPHLRFGTVSVRQIIATLGPGDETFLGELIWREFFMQILHHFPQVVNHNFNPKYNGIIWRNDESDFRQWCEGRTGYPIVDAGMRQLNQTGMMHNRVRMVTAGFLCKHLLIDWRWGEAYFAQKLLDYELSSNNGNWQWAAGTGCDAAPYFRIFNPQAQLKRFDKNLEYVKKWVPEFGTNDYKKPMIEHRFARTRALEVYKQGIGDYIPDH